MYAFTFEICDRYRIEFHKKKNQISFGSLDSCICFPLSQIIVKKKSRTILEQTSLPTILAKLSLHNDPLRDDGISSLDFSGRISIVLFTGLGLRAHNCMCIRTYTHINAYDIVLYV